MQSRTTWPRRAAGVGTVVGWLCAALGLIGTIAPGYATTYALTVAGASQVSYVLIRTLETINTRTTDLAYHLGQAHSHVDLLLDDEPTIPRLRLVRERPPSGL